MTSPIQSHKGQPVLAFFGGAAFTTALPKDTPYSIKLIAGIAAGTFFYAASLPGNDELRAVVSLGGGAAAATLIPIPLSTEMKCVAALAAVVALNEALTPSTLTTVTPRWGWWSPRPTQGGNIPVGTRQRNSPPGVGPTTTRGGRESPTGGGHIGVGDRRRNSPPGQPYVDPRVTGSGPQTTPHPGGGHIPVGTGQRNSPPRRF